MGKWVMNMIKTGYTIEFKCFPPETYLQYPNRGENLSAMEANHYLVNTEATKQVPCKKQKHSPIITTPRWLYPYRPTPYLVRTLALGCPNPIEGLVDSSCGERHGAREEF